MFRYTIPHILMHLMPECTWKVDTPDKKLYFTFDDGPHPEVTPWVLEQLRPFNAKATFFCVGENLERYPEIQHQLKAEGHSIGNHTMHHRNGRKTDNADYFNNIQEFQKIYPTALFRPPYGRTRRSQRLHIKTHFRIILWNRLSRDFEAGLNIQESIHAMKKKPKTGSVFVFHDSAKAFPQLKQILPELLSYYSKSGWKLEALPETGIF